MRTIRRIVDAVRAARCLSVALNLASVAEVACLPHHILAIRI